MGFGEDSNAMNSIASNAEIRKNHIEEIKNNYHEAKKELRTAYENLSATEIKLNETSWFSVKSPNKLKWLLDQKIQENKIYAQLKIVDKSFDELYILNIELQKYKLNTVRSDFDEIYTQIQSDTSTPELKTQIFPRALKLPVIQLISRQLLAVAFWNQ